MNAWESYEAKGHGKGHPKVPEASSYGLVLMAVLMAVLWVVRRRGR